MQKNFFNLLINEQDTLQMQLFSNLFFSIFIEQIAPNIAAIALHTIIGIHVNIV